MSERDPKPILVLAVLVLGMFMTLLDLTIVNIAIPSIVDSLHASLDQVLWVLNAYSLLYAVLLITSARLGDVFGQRNLFAAGVALFTAASALSGLAQDPAQLIAARGLQGLSAAVLAPQGLPILLSVFPPERRAASFAVYGVIGGLAVVAGPTLGGFLVTHLGWRWIFYVNIPIGIATVLLALRFVPDLRPGRRHRLDPAGVVLVTLGLLGVVFGLIEGERYGWGQIAGPLSIPLVLGVGLALLAVFFVQQAARQEREPLLPFLVFADRNFALMTLVLCAMGFAILGFFLPMTIYLQSVLGLSAIDAGLTIAAQPIAMMLSSGVASYLVARVHGKWLLAPGLLAFALGLLYIDWAAQVGAGRWTFLPGLILSGAGMGFVWTPVYSLATRDLRPELAGVASGVLNTIQELGSVIASAAVGALLQNRLAAALHAEAVARSGQVPEAFRDRFVAGFSQAAKGGLEVGAGQTGTALQAPPALQELAREVFTHAFVDATRPTLLLPIAVVVAAALACLLARSGARTSLAGAETVPAEL